MRLQMNEGHSQTWLLTGGSGQVGLALSRLAGPGLRVVVPGRNALDLTNMPDVDALLAEECIAAIVNCGAYTAVDRAESEPELAFAINAEAPGRLATAAARAGIPIIQLSTDYVFGSGEGPWLEDDPVAPEGVYARSKAAGEAAVRDAGARHAILRTSWVVSADGHNFVKTMLRLGAERDSLRVVADQRGAPTHAGDLAQAVAKVARRLVGDRDQPSGTWHCANAGETTWHGLAEHVFACAAERGLPVPKSVAAITTAEYPTPAPRPPDSRLDTSKLARDFGVGLRPWQEAVEAIVAMLAARG